MKFGVCSAPETLSAVRDAGYDYAEWNFSKLAALSEDEFDTVKDTVNRVGLPIEAFNGFFGSGVSLNAGLDLDFVRAHCRRGFARAAALGGKVAVLGSGGARKIPEGYDRTLAEEQFLQALQICGDAAGEVGMTVVLEPLNRRETNFMNSVAEGAAILDRIPHPNLQLLADFYHVAEEKEPLSALIAQKDRIRHLHLALPQTRLLPTVADSEIGSAWRDCLKAMDYEGRISLEGKASPDFETAIRNAKPFLEGLR